MYESIYRQIRKQGEEVTSALQKLTEQNIISYLKRTRESFLNEGNLRKVKDKLKKVSLVENLQEVNRIMKGVSELSSESTQRINQYLLSNQHKVEIQEHLLLKYFKLEVIDSIELSEEVWSVLPLSIDDFLVGGVHNLYRVNKRAASVIAAGIEAQAMVLLPDRSVVGSDAKRKCLFRLVGGVSVVHFEKTRFKGSCLGVTYNPEDFNNILYSDGADCLIRRYNLMKDSCEVEVRILQSDRPGRVQLGTPHGIAVYDRGLLICNCASPHSISLFSREHELQHIETVDSFYLKIPMGVAINGTIAIVADYCNDRLIEVRSNEGVVESTRVIPIEGLPPEAGFEFNSPTGVAWLEDRVFVTLYWLRKIIILQTKE